VRWLRPEEELLVLETMRSPFRAIAKLAASRSCACPRSVRCGGSTSTLSKAS
jgi:hypothetical protein